MFSRGSKVKCLCVLKVTNGCCYMLYIGLLFTCVCVEGLLVENRVADWSRSMLWSQSMCELTLLLLCADAWTPGGSELSYDWLRFSSPKATSRRANVTGERSRKWWNHYMWPVITHRPVLQWTCPPGQNQWDEMLGGGFCSFWSQTTVMNSPLSQVMSAGRSADGREVQIPLQQVAPSMATPPSVAPPITPHSHRPTNPWPPSETTGSQGKPKQPHLCRSQLCDCRRVKYWYYPTAVSQMSTWGCCSKRRYVCLGVPAGFQPLHGGFRDHFVETPEAKYCCESCRLVLCQPRQTECGHRFCHTCINDILRWDSVIHMHPKWL